MTRITTKKSMTATKPVAIIPVERKIPEKKSV
jgi:hypothetical protein